MRGTRARFPQPHAGSDDRHAEGGAPNTRNAGPRPRACRSRPNAIDDVIFPKRDGGREPGEARVVRSSAGHCVARHRGESRPRCRRSRARARTGTASARAIRARGCVAIFDRVDDAEDRVAGDEHRRPAVTIGPLTDRDRQRHVDRRSHDIEQREERDGVWRPSSGASGARSRRSRSSSKASSAHTMRARYRGDTVAADTGRASLALRPRRPRAAAGSKTNSHRIASPITARRRSSSPTRRRSAAAGATAA